MLDRSLTSARGGKAEAPSDPGHRDDAELITTSEGGVVKAGDTLLSLDVAPQLGVGRGDWHNGHEFSSPVADEIC